MALVGTRGTPPGEGARSKLTLAPAVNGRKKIAPCVRSAWGIRFRITARKHHRCPAFAAG